MAIERDSSVQGKKVVQLPGGWDGTIHLDDEALEQAEKLKALADRTLGQALSQAQDQVRQRDALIHGLREEAQSIGLENRQLTRQVKDLSEKLQRAIQRGMQSDEHREASAQHYQKRLDILQRRIDELEEASEQLERDKEPGA